MNDNEEKSIVEDSIWHGNEKPPLAELGASTSPDEILTLIRHHKPITLEFLDGNETCSSFTPGTILGKGKSGSVFELNDDDRHRGLEVVLKKFTVKEMPNIKGLNNGDKLYVLSSSLNDVVMSSLFHSFYDGDQDYCLTFPYFEGFFVCGKEGYAILEKLDQTIAGYIGSNAFDVEVFRGLTFQVIYATRFLNMKKVVHNDMHAKNVMTRSTKKISYRGVKLSEVNYFGFVDEGKIYSLPNLGTIAKILDFDFAAKYSTPKIVPQKVYNKESDNWNLKFRYSTSYDVLTFIGYMAYYTVIRSPGGKGFKRSQIDAARVIVYDLAEFVVRAAETQVGPIPKRKHFEEESDGRHRERDAISKLLDMVSVPQYRPYEEYCHLDLKGILQVPCYKQYQSRHESSFIVGSM